MKGKEIKVNDRSYDIVYLLTKYRQTYFILLKLCLLATILITDS